MRTSQYVVVLLVAAACSGHPTAQQTQQETLPKQEPAPQSKQAPQPKSAPQRTAPSDKPNGTERKATDNVNADALVLQEFKKRIDDYLDIHNKALKEAPPLRETEHPGEIKIAQDAIAARIRAARANARPGDIFTPEIRDKFRRLLYPELKGEDGRDAKEILKDDAPAAVPLTVNAKYPEKASLPTVPANLLANLPTLPEELEYRIVGKHLILRDAKADIIVDYIPNAIR
jgi:hypothetical protein